MPFTVLLGILLAFCDTGRENEVRKNQRHNSNLKFLTEQDNSFSYSIFEQIFMGAKIRSVMTKTFCNLEEIISGYRIIEIFYCTPKLCLFIILRQVFWELGKFNLIERWNFKDLHFSDVKVMIFDTCRSIISNLDIFSFRRGICLYFLRMKWGCQKKWDLLQGTQSPGEAMTLHSSSKPCKCIKCSADWLSWRDEGEISTFLCLWRNALGVFPYSETSFWRSEALSPHMWQLPAWFAWMLSLILPSLGKMLWKKNVLFSIFQWKTVKICYPFNLEL